MLRVYPMMLQMYNLGRRDVNSWHTEIDVGGWTIVEPNRLYMELVF